MLDPYRMVAISTVSSLILLVSVLFYKFIFPKREINLFFLLILISILPILSIFRIGAYESGDFNIHIYRSMEFYRSLSEGIIMPSWAGSLNATYGYPLFIFNYTLPYYIISVLHWTGLSFILSLKSFLALNIVLSGLFMFLFSKKLFGKNLPAFIASIFYVFAPYHLVDVHFKVVIGEILFFTILPLAFLCMYRLKEKANLNNAFLLSLSFAALIMSHLIIAGFAGIFLISYALLFKTNKNSKHLKNYVFISFTVSLLISLSNWLGPVLLSKYSYVQNVVLGTAYFPTLQDLIYSPWRMGFLFQGPHGEISYLLGYVQIFTAILLIFLMIGKKIIQNLRSELLFWIIAFFLTIFFVSPYSKFLWELSPLLRVIGSHRLLILTSFISSILAGYLVLNIKKQWLIYLFAIIAILSTILNWGQRRVIPQINDTLLQKNLPKSTSETEGHFYANTKWVDIKNPWFSTIPQDHLEIISGVGKIIDISRNSINHKYRIEAETPLRIQENTLYFPGWKGYLSKKEILLLPSDKGIIGASIPEGKFMFEINYQDVPIYKTLKIISILTFLAVIMFMLKKFLARKGKRFPT